MLTATYDDASGIITTIAEGLSTKADFDAYLPVLGGMMTRSIAVHGQWLHLVDATRNAVQTRESTAHVVKEWTEAPRGDGFTAYLVTSVLAKMQIERMGENPNKAFFTDPSAARAWLLGHSTTKAPRAAA